MATLSLRIPFLETTESSHWQASGERAFAYGGAPGPFADPLPHTMLVTVSDCPSKSQPMKYYGRANDDRIRTQHSSTTITLSLSSHWQVRLAHATSHHVLRRLLERRLYYTTLGQTTNSLQPCSSPLTSFSPRADSNPYPGSTPLRASIRQLHWPNHRPPSPSFPSFTSPSVRF